MQKWITLNEDRICDNKWFPLYRHIVRLPNNKIINDFYIGRLGTIASILAITSQKEIIFVKQYRHAVNETMIELPAGIVDEGMSVEQTAVKELREEVGASIVEADLKPIGISMPIPHKVEMRVYGYLVENVDVRHEQELDELEDIEILRVHIRDVMNLIKNGEIYQPDAVFFIVKAKLLYPEIFAV